jgi:2-hydroxychromene-2-carboxylate isomerase
MKQVDFYFDFVSPYVWLASHQLGEVRDCTAAKFRFVPVLFAALLDHHSNLGPAEIPAKAPLYVSGCTTLGCLSGTRV